LIWNRNVQSGAYSHGQREAFSRFMAEHVVEGETYRLDERDLERIPAASLNTRRPRPRDWLVREVEGAITEALAAHEAGVRAKAPTLIASLAQAKQRNPEAGGRPRNERRGS
jgi:hypothetical protein